ncbi:F0F1 ATP synthase subunit B [Antrihabitans cavernicola]|uniref:ATP synthase subunit b n=1 Tax=Antrihabitans cavernicola TaxID=2495913 RepID=A0A5A7S4B2_9NOCA|nr:F0F1 ATP synthase subunit B [Spelaeibacter cavernicola]KAA0018045.1 F0F1 ATP synthase subunit B [Spelaeibacter cavernicola]
MDTTVLAAGDNFLIPNGTFFVELIIFAIVLGVIWKFVVPPISAALKERADMVAKTAEDNHKAARAFADADTKYREELANARTEASKIRDGARVEGQKILDDMRSQAKQESDVIQQQSAQDLQAQGDRIATELRSNSGSLATTLADRILGGKSDAASSLADRTGRG